MSETEKDYSAYIAYGSNWASIYSVLMGFTFTAIAIVLTLHPEPSQIAVQAILFTLTILLDIFGLLVYRFAIALAFCVRVVPIFPKAWARWGKTYFSLSAVGWTLLGWVVVLMFFLWNLLYLALASGVVTALVDIIGYTTTVKPSSEFLKEHPRIKK